MMKRYRAWRNRLTSTAHSVGGTPVRLTYQRGRLVGVEFWTRRSNASGYDYTVIKGL